MAKATFEALLSDIQHKKFVPVYVLYGDEPYYIDVLTNHLVNNALEEHERDFNQTIVYGADVVGSQVMEYAKQFPMMAERTLVVVKEAQNVKKYADLEPYAKAVNSSCVLVLAFKNGKPDKRLTVFKELEKKGVFFESKRLYDNQMPKWVTDYTHAKKLKITPKAALLISESLGTNLSKVANEIDKLAVQFPAGTEINDKIVEENIGISKEFNVFELQSALGQRNIEKANRIVNYFAANPKNNPLVVTVSQLYNYFSKILKVQFTKNASQAQLASMLRVNPFFVKDFTYAANNYSIKQTVRAIELLAEYDLKSKGYNNTSSTDGELLREMIYKILHAPRA